MESSHNFVVHSSDCLIQLLTMFSAISLCAVVAYYICIPGKYEYLQMYTGHIRVASSFKLARAEVQDIILYKNVSGRV